MGIISVIIWVIDVFNLLTKSPFPKTHGMHLQNASCLLKGLGVEDLESRGLGLRFILVFELGIGMYDLIRFGWRLPRGTTQMPFLGPICDPSSLQISSSTRLIST